MTNRGALDNARMLIVRWGTAFDSMYYSFLSGVFVSLSANLLTGVFSAEQATSRTRDLLLAALISLVASVAWLFAAWRISAINQFRAKANAAELNEAELLVAIAKAHASSLGFSLVLAVALSLTCMVVMVPDWLLKFRN